MSKTPGTRYFYEGILPNKTQSKAYDTRLPYSDNFSSYYSPNTKYNADYSFGVGTQDKIQSSKISYTPQANSTMLKKEEDEKVSAYSDNAMTTKRFSSSYKKVETRPSVDRDNEDIHIPTIKYSNSKDIRTKLYYDINEDIPTNKYKSEYREVCDTVVFGNNVDIPTKKHVQQDIHTVKRSVVLHNPQDQKDIKTLKQDSSWPYKKEEKKPENVEVKTRHNNDELRTIKNYHEESEALNTVKYHDKYQNDLSTKKRERKYEEVLSTVSFGKV